MVELYFECCVALYTVCIKIYGHKEVVNVVVPQMVLIGVVESHYQQ